MLRRRRPAWGVRRRQDISEPDSTDVFRVSGRVPWHVLPDSRDAQGLRRCHPEVLFDSRTRRRRQDGSQAIAQHGVTSQTAPTPLRDIAAKSTASLSRNRRQHEQESTEKSSTQGKKDGALHGLHGRLGGLPVGHGIPCQTACGCPAAPIPLRWATSHVARPRTHHEEAEQPPKAEEEEKEEEAGEQPASSTKEFDPGLFRSCRPSQRVHEQVPKDNRPPSGKKGDPRPQQLPGISEQIVHTQRPTSP